MADQWYYRQGDNQSGPVSPQELRRAAIAGELQPTDSVRKEGMADWVAASQVKGLFPTPSRVQDTPPPVPVAADLPPPLPQDPASPEKLQGCGSTDQKTNKPTAQTRVPVPKPVAIAMGIAVSLPLLLSLLGLVAFLRGDLNMRTAIAIWVTFIQNTIALYACVMTLRGTTRYWLPATASILTFIAWFWLSFASVQQSPVVAGTILSIAIGIWSFLVLRKPDVRSAFEGFDPMTTIGQHVLARLPKVTIAPTPGNTTRACLFTLLGLSVVGILLGPMLGGPREPSYMKQSAAEHAAAMEALKSADQSWASGNKEVAIEAYTHLLLSDRHQRFLYENAADASRAYCRVINDQVERGGPEAGREMIRNAIRRGNGFANISLSLTNPAANAIVTEERKAYKAEQDESLARSGSSGENEDWGGNSLIKGGDWSANSVLKGKSRGRSPSPSSFSVKGDGVEGEATINRDGSYSGSIRGDGFSGRSKMNADGSGVGEYDVDGKKMRVQVDGRGGASVDVDGQTFNMPKP